MKMTLHERTQAAAHLSRKRAQAERAGKWEMAALYEKRQQALEQPQTDEAPAGAGTETSSSE